MTKANSAEDLTEEHQRFLLIEATRLGGNVVEELSVVHVFQHQIAAYALEEFTTRVLGRSHLSTIFPNIIELHDVRMLDQFHDGNLSFNTNWHSF